jgi:hypothetical protein
MLVVDKTTFTGSSPADAIEYQDTLYTEAAE